MPAHLNARRPASGVGVRAASHDRLPRRSDIAAETGNGAAVGGRPLRGRGSEAPPSGAADPQKETKAGGAGARKK
jgi:hypothetical protein